MHHINILGYYTSYKYTLEELEKMERKLQQITIPSVDESKEPTLKVIPFDNMEN